ncbi:uncharacterized protein LOC124535206 [Vanessa cardui]|uniref:uncharacterized protein LOC124535206 n=1 Tax=Vanessa cardui TaxID=171605 RepID=UPI001F130019|nr:uncharacterized protein LOC124535206 [Vanessa cardui]
MIKLLVFLTVIISVLSAEIPSPGILNKDDTHKPEIEESIETHSIQSKITKSEQEHHPVYRSEEHKDESRARIEPVRSRGPIIKHDMLADEPSGAPFSDDNNYGFAGPMEVAYPDIPYAPGYGYRHGYAGQNNYDLYGISDDFIEPDTSSFGLLWSQVPDSRTLVNYAGRTISWVFSSIFVLMLGSFLTIGLCTYTDLCRITFNGVGPIHEEMRSLITPERLEKISNAADFVKTAINKYQTIQRVPEPGTRKRRSIFY